MCEAVINPSHKFSVCVCVCVCVCVHMYMYVLGDIHLQSIHMYIHCTNFHYGIAGASSNEKNYNKGREEPHLTAVVCAEPCKPSCLSVAAGRSSYSASSAA